MTNFRTKLTSLILAACMLCAVSVSASAAEINQSGGSDSDCEPSSTETADHSDDNGDGECDFCDHKISYFSVSD